MQTNSTIPATKPQPVVVFGAIIAAATTIVSGLVVLLKDNPTAILYLGIAGVVVAGAGVFKDQIVKGQVVPFDDVVAYANDERQVVTGPASTGPAGEIVQTVEAIAEDTEPLETDSQGYPQTYGSKSEATGYDPKHDQP